MSNVYRKILHLIEISLNATIAEQVEHIRAAHLEATGIKLSRREAIRVLDEYRADCRIDARAAKPGLGLCCPFCYGFESDMMIDPSKPGHIYCFRCEEGFSAEEAIEEIGDTLEPWQRYHAFIKARKVEPASAEPAPSPALAEALAACGCRS